MIMAASQLMQNSKYDRTASIHGLCGDVVVAVCVVASGTRSAAVERPAVVSLTRGPHTCRPTCQWPNCTLPNCSGSLSVASRLPSSPPARDGRAGRPVSQTPSPSPSPVLLAFRHQPRAPRFHGNGKLCFAFLLAPRPHRLQAAAAGLAEGSCHRRRLRAVSCRSARVPRCSDDARTQQCSTHAQRPPCRHQPNALRFHGSGKAGRKCMSIRGRVCLVSLF